MILGKSPVIDAITYFVGWQTTIGGKNIKKMVMIKENGSYEIVDRS